MNNSPFWTLLNVNLRLNNPQVTNQLRKKGKTGKRLSRSLWRQNVSQGLIFVLLYGGLMVTLDFSKFPGFFTHYAALFLLIAVSTGISSIYNVFFDAQDLSSYLSLPFKMRDVFISKIVVVAATITPLILPLFVLFLLTGWRAGVWLPATILLALLLFLLVLIISLALCSLIVFSLAQTAVFKKHRQLVTTGLLFFSLAIMVVGILVINNQANNVSGSLRDQAILQLFLPLFQVLVQPGTLTGLRSALLILAVAAILIVLIRMLIMPKLFESLLQDRQAIQAKKNSASKTTNRTKSTPTALRGILWRYNRQILMAPNLLLQILTSSLLTPVIFIVSVGFSDEISLGSLDWHWSGVFFVGGLFLALLTVNQYGFIANLISLDKKNFDYVRALPVSLRYYLQQKFQLGFLVQAGLNLLVTLLIKVFFNIPWTLFFVLVLGTLWGTYLLCLRYFSRDYRMLNLNWTDLNQLFNRGLGRWGLLLLLSVAFILGLGLIGIYSFAVFTWHNPLLDLAVFAAFLILGLVIRQYYQRHFWQKFV